jgi:Sec-independent protein translocase protein TatA
MFYRTQFTILLVGYFVLGPSDLYKLTKEIGTFFQTFKTFTAEATATFENTMESNLQLDEIRKAQRDLNEAFSFRRSINVDAESEAFEVNAKSARGPSPTDPTPASFATERPSASTRATTTEADKGAGPKKKIRRRVRKREAIEEFPLASEIDPTNLNQNVFDLDMTETMRREQEADDKAMKSLEEARVQLWNEREDLNQEQRTKDEGTPADEWNEAQTQLRRQRMERMQASENQLSFDDGEEDQVQRELASEAGYDNFLGDTASAESRFQAQFSGSWNDQIMSNTDALKPLAAIMERLAALEEEKNAADARLQEEFRLREENEEKFYREKRRLLEESAATFQG